MRREEKENPDKRGFAIKSSLRVYKTKPNPADWRRERSPGTKWTKKNKLLARNPQLLCQMGPPLPSQGVCWILTRPHGRCGTSAAHLPHICCPNGSERGAAGAEGEGLWRNTNSNLNQRRELQTTTRTATPSPLTASHGATRTGSPHTVLLPHCTLKG